MQTTIASPVQVRTVTQTNRFIGIGLSMFLGIVFIAGAGFAGSEVLHNAAHDTRHAAAFPCH